MTDVTLKAKSEEIAGKSKNVTVDQALAEVKRHIKLDANEPDARLRIMMLSASYLEQCEKRGREFFEKSQKAAMKQIISVLQPPRLKARMGDALELDRADLEKDYFGFMEKFSRKSQNVRRGFAPS